MDIEDGLDLNVDDNPVAFPGLDDELNEFPTDFYHPDVELETNDSVQLEVYQKYANIADAIYDLMRGPDVKVYYNDTIWCLPMTKGEAAMSLLSFADIPDLKEKMMDYQISDDEFFIFFFLLCVDRGIYNFSEKISGYNITNGLELYKAVTRVDVPIGNYNIDDTLYTNIKFSLSRGYHMYYFIIYSRRAYQVDKLLQRLNGFNGLQQLEDYILDMYTFSELSIQNNKLAVLWINYHQCFEEDDGDFWGGKTKKIMQELGIEEAYFLNTSELVFIYENYKSFFGEKTSIPKLEYTEDDRIIITYIDFETNERKVVEDLSVLDKNIAYYISAISSLIKTKHIIKSGILSKLCDYYTSMRYSIDYLNDLRKNIDEERDENFIYGVALHHLLVHCINGRTSRFVDKNDNLLYKEPLNRIVREINEIKRESKYLITIPILESNTLPQVSEPLKTRLNLTFYLGRKLNINFSTTAGIICKLLDIPERTYAKIINRLITKLDLKKTYGIIDTEIDFESLNEYWNYSVSREFTKLDIFADFAGRSLLAFAEKHEDDYNSINRKLDIYSMREEKEIVEQNIPLFEPDYEREDNIDEMENPYYPEDELYEPEYERQDNIDEMEIPDYPENFE